MLTPQDIAAISPQSDSASLAQQASIEAAYDKALENAARTESWPATMPTGGRSGWVRANVKAVADKYRAAGWQVLLDDKFNVIVVKP